MGIVYCCEDIMKAKKRCLLDTDWNEQWIKYRLFCEKGTLAYVVRVLLVGGAKIIITGIL